MFFIPPNGARPAATDVPADADGSPQRMGGRRRSRGQCVGPGGFLGPGNPPSLQVRGHPSSWLGVNPCYGYFAVPDPPPPLLIPPTTVGA